MALIQVDLYLVQHDLPHRYCGWQNVMDRIVKTRYCGVGLGYFDTSSMALIMVYGSNGSGNPIIRIDK